jgi:hypothetical protein
MISIKIPFLSSKGTPVKNILGLHNNPFCRLTKEFF